MAIKRCAFVRLLSLGCVIILHTPGGTELHVATQGMTVWQPLPQSSEKNVAPGVKAIIDSGGKRYGVIETVQDIDEARDRCGEE